MSNAPNHTGEDGGTCSREAQHHDARAADRTEHQTASAATTQTTTCRLPTGTVDTFYVAWNLLGHSVISVCAVYSNAISLIHNYDLCKRN